MKLGKMNGTNKIIVKEVYDKKKKRIDGRSSNSKYITLIEEILMSELTASNRKFYRICCIGDILGIVNDKFYKNKEYHLKLAFENYIDDSIMKEELINLIKERLRSYSINLNKNSIKKGI